MTLQSSGSISLNDIATEFGGTTPHAISEYYGVATGVPSSGTIALTDFYGTSASTPSSLTMTLDSAYDNNSCTYLDSDRAGYGATGTSDFYYPESCSPYYSGFGSLTNATQAFTGCTVSMIQMEQYDFGRDILTFGVENLANSNSGWSSIDISGYHPGFSQTLSYNFTRSSAYYFTHHRLLNSNNKTVRCWAWDNDNTGTYFGSMYSANTGNAIAIIFYAASTNLNVTVTLNY